MAASIMSYGRGPVYEDEVYSKRLPGVDASIVLTDSDIFFGTLLGEEMSYFAFTACLPGEYEVSSIDEETGAKTESKCEACPESQNLSTGFSGC